MGGAGPRHGARSHGGTAEPDEADSSKTDPILQAIPIDHLGAQTRHFSTVSPGLCCLTTSDRKDSSTARKGRLSCSKAVSFFRCVSVVGVIGGFANYARKRVYQTGLGFTQIVFGEVPGASPGTPNQHTSLGVL